MCVKDADAVVTHNVDEVDVGQPGPQLADHLPPVLQQHGVELALIPAEGGVPGEDVISVSIVKHWGGREMERLEDNTNTPTSRQ